MHAMTLDIIHANVTAWGEVGCAIMASILDSTEFDMSYSTKCSTLVMAKEQY